VTLAASHRRDPVPGLIAAAIVLSVYGAIAISADFSRAAFGLQSDEATYYMMGHSLAEDGDFAYRREDLARVWREFPSGPSGVFLKKGTDLELRATGNAPFLMIERRPDPDTAQLFYGKSYIYPLAAAPFVVLFGTNGFLFFHAILLALATLAAYLFLNARSSPVVSLVLASAFLMASVAPTYFVWITPELFNFSLVLLGYFCWLYKEVAAPETSPRGTTWLFKPGSDLAAAALLGLATFSKPSNLLLILPLLAWLLARRQWKRLILAAVLFGAVGAVLLAGNVAITGDWNFQGGDRRTFYGSYPFQERGTPWEEVGQDRAVLLPGPLRDCRVPARARKAGAMAVADPRRRGGRSPADAPVGPLHFQRRRRVDREPLLHEHVRGAPVPAAAHRVGGLGGRPVGRWRPVLGPGDVQPVLLVVQPCGAGEAGPAALAPGRTHAGERPADQHAAEPCADLVR
jgi:hypothetical protein